MTKLVQARL